MQVSEFFREHTVPAASHALDQARDKITDCVGALRAAQGANLKQWLRTEAVDAPPFVLR